MGAARVSGWGIVLHNLLQTLEMEWQFFTILVIPNGSSPTLHFYTFVLNILFHPETCHVAEVKWVVNVDSLSMSFERL